MLVIKWYNQTCTQNMTGTREGGRSSGGKHKKNIKNFRSFDCYGAEKGCFLKQNNC